MWVFSIKKKKSLDVDKMWELAQKFSKIKTHATSPIVNLEIKIQIKEITIASQNIFFVISSKTASFN
jgi:hypothetical protein